MEPSLIPFPSNNRIIGISPVAYMKDLGSHIRIVVNHHHLFEYKKEDNVSKVASIVTLLRTGAAKQTEIAKAFDINRDTARRYLYNVEKYGLAGLFMSKTGPQGPHKITPKVHRFIVERLHLNQGVAAILKAVKEEFDLELSRKSIERIRDSLSERSSTEVTTVPMELPFEHTEESVEQASGEPLLVKNAISSDDTLEAGIPQKAPAGLFLLWPFLHLLGFKDIVNAVFSPLRARLFFVRETLLTILVLAFLRCRSVEDYKTLEKRRLGLFWEGSRGMDLRTLRRKLSLLTLEKKSLSFLTQLARRYQEIGLVQCGVLYFDGHFIPYYGVRNLHKGFFTRRRLAVAGQNQFFLNDTNGRPIFFWLKPADKTLLKMIPAICGQIKELTGQERFTIVFDRGGFSSKLFYTLDKSEKITFITYLRGHKEHVAPSAFNRYTIEYRRREEEAELAELGYIGMRPQHYRLVVRKKGEKQTFILTNDFERPIDQIATLMFNRWSQENFIKYMVREYHLDSLLSYLAEESSEVIMVKNPTRVENRRMKKQLEQELQQLERFLAEKLAVSRKRAPSKRMAQKILKAQQCVSEIRESIKRLNIQHREMPKKIPASELGDNRAREILCQEKKMLVDSLKLLAYNAEEWLLDILAKKYNDSRDFRRVLLLIVKQPGTIQRIDDRIVIHLHSLHNPRYQRAAEYLCDQINQMKIPAPSGKGTMFFGVRKTL
jgi:transposase